jgi:hypothetical protein
MKRFVRPGAFLLLAALLFCLSGCYSGNIDQYFSLPMASEEYRQLQSLIDEELASGSEYAAPIHGSYRQSVQLSDVDGDGADEALAFFRDAAKNPKINIYDSENGEYRLALSISGEGSSIGRIDYADLTGDGQKELLVSWQISSGLSVLGVYSLAGWSGDVLLSTDSAEFVTGDINRDGCDELLNLRAANSTTYLVDQYTFPLGQEPQATSAALSAGISALQRLRMVTLAGDAPALLAESTLTTGDLVSDLFVCRDGSLINLTMNRTTQISETHRSYSLVYAQDIDGDGSTEIPHPQQLYSRGDEVFWSIAWFRYDASGRASMIMTTYHCVTDNWYLVLPSGWDVGLTVRRDDSVSGERAVILSRLRSDGSLEDYVAIYAITGENRYERARLDNRFLLQEEGTTVYAAKILDGKTDENTIRSRFHVIYTDWSSGSVVGG